ncbi:MAG TPA: ATP-binding cassette domain-containing protein, partial [Burkholderiales bacterium]|nr:ATP-binding cassette domain-containing protein [Burkholderiales bacterium]
ENSEGVALYRGEPEELGGLRGRFAAVIGNFWQIMYKRKQLGWFTSFYYQLAIIFPYIVVSPRFFSGAIPLGAIFQTASAFGQVQGSLSWFIDAYVRFAAWKATVDRLIGFSAALDQVREEADRLDGERVETADSTIALEGLELKLPQGNTLLTPTTLALKPGEDTLLTGPSGAGKSTFFRALSGIWPYWKGRIRVPRGARLLFLPQKAYLPIGTLKRAVCYPDDPAQHSDESVRATLTDVGLAALAGALERSENWAQVLSGGEQQRLAFARALLTKPDWLFLDEATASLPEENQQRLYQLLKERLPGTTLVSIGHRASLAAHHRTRLDWQSGALREVPA